MRQKLNIAFDADDTLWHSENHYHAAQDAFTHIVAPYGPGAEQALAALHEIEINNLASFGYGIKGFVLSMIEAAVKLSGGALRAVEVQAIIDLGRAMTIHEIILLPGAREAVLRLAEDHPILLITKGDLMDQQRKIRESGLAEYFSAVEIVPDKTPAIYETLLARHAIAPERFLMIGNSLRSDIMPALALGGYAVYVPYELSWAHEAAVELPTAVDGRYHEIASLADLPELVTRLEQNLPESR
jgi:putative hydrolase of the HAD superfamily